MDDTAGGTRASPEDLRRWEMLLRHREHAVTVVRRKYGDRAEAEDCVHDAMLRLAGRDDLDPERLHSLLTRTALNIAVDHRRARRREERAVVRLGGGAMAEAVSPEDLLAERTETERLLATTDELPRRERQVFLLRSAGLSPGEVARFLGLSYKSVEGAYTRARARIRMLLGGVLAWLATRLRRVNSSGGEAAALATVAALLLVGPFFGGDARRSPATGDHHDGDPSGGTAALWTAASQGRPTSPDGSGGRPGRGGGGSGQHGGRPGDDGQHPYAVIGVQHLVVPEPNGGDGQPPLVSTGLIITIGPIKSDPVGATEQCLEQGPTISVTDDFCGN